MTSAIEEKQQTPIEYIQQETEHRAKPLATIHSWAVVESPLSPDFAKLQAGNRLRGHVLGLAHLSYAKVACTSPIVSVDTARGLVETRNTIYRLGEIREAYSSWRGARH
jgi:hypothetical protein